MSLARREFDLLALLVTDRHRAISRDELLRSAWGSSSAWQHEATVTEHVRRLRAKLGPEAGNLIETVRGVAYRFVA